MSNPASHLAEAVPTRRTFLTSLGAFSTAALIPTHDASAAPTASHGEMRGLAPAADYLFDPGLVYLNTGSLGTTPVPVLERTVAAWKQLERNPVFHVYSRATRAMDEVRACRAIGSMAIASRPTSSTPRATWTSW